MVSRVFVIIVALAAAVHRFTTGAVLEATGLLGLAGGLIFLKAAEKQPSLKRFAYLSFALAAVIVAYVLYRNSR